MSNHSEATPPDVAEAWKPEGQTVAASEQGPGGWDAGDAFLPPPHTHILSSPDVSSSLLSRQVLARGIPET